MSSAIVEIGAECLERSRANSGSRNVTIYDLIIIRLLTASFLAQDLWSQSFPFVARAECAFNVNAFVADGLRANESGFVCRR